MYSNGVTFISDISDNLLLLYSSVSELNLSGVLMSICVISELNLSSVLYSSGLILISVNSEIFGNSLGTFCNIFMVFLETKLFVLRSLKLIVSTYFLFDLNSFIFVFETSLFSEFNDFNSVLVTNDLVSFFNSLNLSVLSCFMKSSIVYLTIRLYL